MVQMSAVLIVDFTSLIATGIITGMGTMLTLYLGLKVERKRVKREEDIKKQAEIKIFHDALTANEIRSIHGYDPSPMIMETFSEPDHFFFREPSASAHMTVSSSGIGLNVDPMSRQFTNDAAAESKAIQFIEPSPIASVDLLPEDWGLAADADDTEIEVEPGYAICKHCYRQIKGHVHAEGMNRGKMRCDPDDTLGGYGYNAEPSDAECGKNCLGYSGHTANS